MLLRSFGILFLIAFLFFCSTTGNVKDSGIASDLDTAIARTAEAIIEKVPARTKIALFNISTNESVLTEYVIEELSAFLVERGNFIIVDRKNLDVIEAEQQFQLSGNVRDDDIRSIGKKYGASSVVTCSITGQADLRRLRVRTLDVETGEVQSLTTHPIGDIADDARYQRAQEVQINQMEEPFVNVKNYFAGKSLKILILDFPDNNGRKILLGQYISNELKNFLSRNTACSVEGTDLIKLHNGLDFVDWDTFFGVGAAYDYDVIIRGRLTNLTRNINVQLDIFDYVTGRNLFSNSFELNEKRFFDMFTEM